MFDPVQAGQSSTLQSLRFLIVLRNLAIIGQASTVVVVSHWLAMPLPLLPMCGVIGLLALINVLSYIRLALPMPVSNQELCAQLLIDVTALTLLLYFSGGGANPFISMYLLPLAIAAAILPGNYTWALGGVTVACYTLLMVYFVPLPQAHGHGHGGVGDDFALHIVGMWGCFVLSAAVIAGFVARMAASLRERDRLLAEAREKALRDDQIVALGAFAAGAAHELGTPLSTMTITVEEMRHDYRGDDELRYYLDTLREQLESCKTIISRLLMDAGQARAEAGQVQAVDEFLKETLGKWRGLHPGAQIQSHWSGPRPPPRILVEQTLCQSLISLLNNAFEASPQGIELQGCWSAAELAIEIHDHGRGLTPEVRRRAKEAFFTTKPQGSGLGLFLASAAVERLGGCIVLHNRAEGGVCTRILLPLAVLSVA